MNADQILKQILEDLDPKNLGFHLHKESQGEGIETWVVVPTVSSPVRCKYTIEHDLKYKTITIGGYSDVIEAQSQQKVINQLTRLEREILRRKEKIRLEVRNRFILDAFGE